MRVTVLVVEDNANDMAWIKNLLDTRTRTHFDMICVSSFPAARAAMAGPERIDLVVTDYYIGGEGDGADVVREAVKRAIPVVVMTGKTPAEIAEEVSTIGAMRVVSKGEVRKRPQILDDLVDLARAQTAGTLLPDEPSPRQVMEALRAENEKLRKSQGSIPAALHYLDSNPGVAWALVFLLVAGIAAAIIIGSWPGG